MPKAETSSHQKRVRGAFIRLMLAARKLNCPMGALTAALAELEGLLSLSEIADQMDSPPFTGHLKSERKPPARVIAYPGASTAGGEAVVSVLPRPHTDFGEPWRIAPLDPTLVVDRAGTEIHAGFGSELAADDDLAYARRIAATANLCAGAPTEALEHAFEEISAATPRWALLALDIQNLDPGQIARIREFIDQVVAHAAVPAPDQECGAPQ